MAQGRIFHRFVAFEKVDEELREVWGDATVEEIDKQKEIVRFPGAVKAFDAQDIYFTKASKGKSKGNVRSMHQPIAAGRVIAWEADEKRKAIPIGTKIDDDKEWGKAKAGTYIGFSIGGEVTKEHKETIDGEEINVIDEFDLIEVSLVDHPACPSAVFSVVKMVKADPAPLAPQAPIAPDPPTPVEKAEKEPTTVQTLIFDKKKFDAAAAKKWAREHDFKGGAVDETEDSIRIRQKDPGDFKEGSFRTIELKDGVKAVVGHLKVAIGRFGKILKAAGKTMEKGSEAMSIYPALCALRDLQNALDAEAFEIAMGEDLPQEKADIATLYVAVEAVLEFLGSEFQQEVRSYLAAEAGADGRPMRFLEWAETLSKALSPSQFVKVMGDEDMKANLEAIHRMGHGLVTASSVMGSGCPDKVCKEEDDTEDGEEDGDGTGDGEGEEDGEGEGAEGAEGEGEEEDGEGDDGEGEDDGEEEDGKGKKIATPAPAGKVVPAPAAAATPRTSTGKKILKSLAKVQEELGGIRASVKAVGKRVKTLEELPTPIGRPPAEPHDKKIPGVDVTTAIADPLALLRKRAEEETDPVRKQTLTLILTEETIKLQQAGIRVA